MKIFIILLSFMRFATADSEVLGTYGLHLFFNEKEFVDVLIIEEAKNELKGTMVVPNDFTGSLSNIVIKDLQLTYDLFVPKNASRPKDLVFTYHTFFFDHSFKQFYGYVTLKNQNEFVASFVGFKRSNDNL